MVGHKLHLYITGTNTAGRNEYRCVYASPRWIVFPAEPAPSNPTTLNEWSDVTHPTLGGEKNEKRGEKKHRPTQLSRARTRKKSMPNSRWSSTFPVFLTSQSNTGPWKSVPWLFYPGPVIHTGTAAMAGKQLDSRHTAWFRTLCLFWLGRRADTCIADTAYYILVRGKNI